jgi:hypothetical protein
LFWKTGKTTEQIFSVNATDQRSSFRVVPPSDHPLQTVFRGRTVSVEDIGAAGLSFSDDDFRAGDSDVVVLELPGASGPISARTEIIAVDGKNICHCRFVGLDEDAFNAIHKYMLALHI